MSVCLLAGYLSVPFDFKEGASLQMILVCRPAVQVTAWQTSGAAFLPTFTLEGLCTPRSGAEDHSTVISGPGTTAVGSLWEKSEKWGQAKLLPSSK